MTREFCYLANFAIIIFIAGRQHRSSSREHSWLEFGGKVLNLLLAITKETATASAAGTATATATASSLVLEAPVAQVHHVGSTLWGRFMDVFPAVAAEKDSL